MSVDPQLPIWFEASGVLITVAIMGLAIVALITLVKTSDLTGIQRLVWVSAIIFLPVVGPILWLTTRGILRRLNPAGQSGETTPGGA